MKKAYIAAPYRSKSVDQGQKAYGKIADEDYKAFLELIDKVLKRSGYSTHLPHRDNNKWGDVYLEPLEMVRRCYKQIASCTLFACYPRMSRGVHIELGIATCLGKRIVIFMHEKEEMSSVVAGLNALTSTTVLRFKDNDDLRLKLEEYLEELNNVAD